MTDRPGGRATSRIQVAGINGQGLQMSGPIFHLCNAAQAWYTFM